METLKKIGRVGLWVGIGLVGVGVAVGAKSAAGTVDAVQLVLGAVETVVALVRAIIEAIKK